MSAEKATSKMEDRAAALVHDKVAPAVIEFGRAGSSDDARKLRAQADATLEEAIRVVSAVDTADISPVGVSPVGEDAINACR